VKRPLDTEAQRVVPPHSITCRYMYRLTKFRRILLRCYTAICWLHRSLRVR